ncbi:hypothetical protein ACHAWF_004135 [Thalassiosira exigua]
MRLEIEETKTNIEESILSFVEDLKLIKSRAKGFVCKLVTDKFNKNVATKKKKLLGVLWQTATMQRNFELFGDHIGLDVMKKGLLSLLCLDIANDDVVLGRNVHCFLNFDMVLGLMDVINRLNDISIYVSDMALHRLDKYHQHLIISFGGGGGLDGIA